SSNNDAQDACNADAPESSGTFNPTATSKSPPAEQMESLIVESAIPTFEDILGVTTNADESNRVEADVGNMETTIIASPTPTLRIHRDHLKCQIIGPVDTLIQTKNKSKEVFDALQDPSCVEAMQEELLKFKIQKVWSLVDCPKRVRPIGTKCVSREFSEVLVIQCSRVLYKLQELAGSESRPPMLNKENNVPWSSRLLQYAKSRPNRKLIHNSILNEPYVRRMIPEPGDANREVNVTKTFHLQTDDELFKKELKQNKADDQAIQTILLENFIKPKEQQIAQPGMNMGQDRQMQMVRGNGGNQFRQYAGNPAGYNDVIENQVNQNAVQNPRIQNVGSINLGTQTDSAPIYDTDGSAEVHENCDDNEIFNMFTQEEQYTELLEPIPESHQVPQNDNDVISEDTSVEQAGQNGNQVRCYNCRGFGHYARNCTARPRRRDAAYLQTQLLIAQKEEAGIQL
nr:hypothetical protein [Tanacetum cinerariifolium]